MSDRIEVDYIELACNGCKQVRKFYPDRPIRGAEELIEWLKTKPTQCPNVLCTATTCDVKARLKQ